MAVLEQENHQKQMLTLSAHIQQHHKPAQYRGGETVIGDHLKKRRNHACRVCMILPSIDILRCETPADHEQQQLL